MSILRTRINTLVFCALPVFVLSIPAEANSSFWEVNGCRVSGTSANITLSTDASISHNKIHFRVVSDVVLKDAPELQLNTARFTGFDLEGSGKGFGFEMEYSPAQVSYFLKPEAMLVAAYDPAYKEEDGSYYTYHAAFPMQELPELIAEISETCKSYRVSQN